MSIIEFITLLIVKKLKVLFLPKYPLLISFFTDIATTFIDDSKEIVDSNDKAILGRYCNIIP